MLKKCSTHHSKPSTIRRSGSNSLSCTVSPLHEWKVCNRYLVEQLITPGSIPAFSVGEEMRCGSPVATFYHFCCHLPSHLLPPSITSVATFHHFCCHLPSHLLPPSIPSVATFHHFCGSGMILYWIWILFSKSFPILTAKNQYWKFDKKNSNKRNCAATVPNSTSCVCERFIYIPTIDLPIMLQELCGPILEINKSLTDTWMWKLGLNPRISQKRNT